MTTRSYRMLAAAVAGSLAFSVSAFAGDRGKDSGAAEIKMMDTDHNGKLSAAEHTTGARAMFEKMDADKDGRVTAAEMDAARKDWKAGHGDKSASADKADHDKAGPDKAGYDGKRGKMMSSAEKIAKLDTNGDGQLSAGEHAAGSEQMFQKMDTDQDGQLTAAEITAGHKSMMRSAQAE